MAFWAYMIHCRAGRFYTGQTDDLDRRMAEHQSGKFPGFTSARHPLELVWSESFPSRYEAICAEQRIKGWTRKKKLALIRGDWDEISRLAKKKGSASTSSARAELGSEVVVAGSVVAAILAEAHRAAPEEACGLLLGVSAIGRAITAANVHPTPRTHFEIDPLALIAAHKAARAGGPALAGYWHSHPSGPPEPSDTDRAHASGDGRVWAIAGEGRVTFWRDGPDGFEALCTVPVDG